MVWILWIRWKSFEIIVIFPSLPISIHLESLVLSIKLIVFYFLITKYILEIHQNICTERVLRYEVKVKSLKPRIVALRRAEVSREKFSSETSEKTVYRKKVNVSVKLTEEKGITSFSLLIPIHLFLKNFYILLTK